MDEDYKEITLADIVGTLGRRKLVLGSVFILVLLAGVAFTAFTTPEYESKTTIVPLEHGDIIQNWLDSRHAAELVALDMGDPLVSKLFPERWNANAQNWIGEPPTREAAGKALAEATEVSQFTRDDKQARLLSVTVRMTDPLLAKSVADGFIRTLDVLRPDLEAIVQQEAFDQYYDGSNEQEAQGRAEVKAKQMNYWLVLDTANTPEGPVSPNVVLNIALSVVLGLMLAVFAVFFWEWMANYRLERKTLEVPGEAAAEAPKKRERRFS